MIGMGIVWVQQQRAYAAAEPGLDINTGRATLRRNLLLTRAGLNEKRAACNYLVSFLLLCRPCGDHPKAVTRAAETDCQYICYPHLLERSVSTEVGFARKAVITFAISVRLPTCISADSKDFREIGYWGISWHFVEKFQIWLKSDNVTAWRNYILIMKAKEMHYF